MSDPPPAREESTEISTTPSLGFVGDGRTKSALTEQRMSVEDPGRWIREEPLERTREETTGFDELLGHELLLVLME